MPSHSIRLRGVRTHNLKMLNLELPSEKLIVLTGPSGSGKSSLAFDTLALEGQRRYLGSLSLSLKSHLNTLERPPVDLISHLPPTVSVKQERESWGRRDNLGSLTDISDFLSTLYARLATFHCPSCERPMKAQEASEVADFLLSQDEGARYSLLAPILDHDEIDPTLIKSLMGAGFVRVHLDGEMCDLESLVKAPPKGLHRLDLVIDRFKIRQDLLLRLLDSIETAFKMGGGRLLLESHPRDGKEAKEQHFFSKDLRCFLCDLRFQTPSLSLFSPRSKDGACKDCQEASLEPCESCGDTLLGPLPRKSRLGGLRLEDALQWPLQKSIAALQDMNFQGHDKDIAEALLEEILTRSRFLIELGLSELPLCHRALWLSTGEASRVRLAAQLGPQLHGVLYILDEPARGLHPKDGEALARLLKSLSEKGNTVLVVAHHPQLMVAADCLIELGPKAGIEGGEILSEGPLQALSTKTRSLSYPWLSGKTSLPPPNEIPKDASWLSFNKPGSPSFRFPLNSLVMMTGRSGSGKSRLVFEDFLPALLRHIEASKKATVPPSNGSIQVSGPENIARVLHIDASPMGQSKRSCPATLTGVLGPLRKLFAATQEARIRGFSPSRFSFNTKGGRCELCEGQGQVQEKMGLLPDFFVRCEACHGHRYNEATLAVHYHGLSMAEVLEKPIHEIRPVFEAIPGVSRVLNLMSALGLSYLSLGQRTTSLSGGEQQRLKLVKELAKPSVPHTLYVLDQPSSGLHFSDLLPLHGLLSRLKDEGHSILLIDQSMALLEASSWVIELDRKGQILYEGQPAKMGTLSSDTAQSLALWQKGLL